MWWNSDLEPGTEKLMFLQLHFNRAVKAEDSTEVIQLNFLSLWFQEGKAQKWDDLPKVIWLISDRARIETFIAFSLYCETLTSTVWKLAAHKDPFKAVEIFQSVLLMVIILKYMGCIGITMEVCLKKCSLPGYYRQISWVRKLLRQNFCSKAHDQGNSPFSKKHMWTSNSMLWCLSHPSLKIRKFRFNMLVTDPLTVNSVFRTH